MHRRLNVTDGHVGFRRRATLDESPETAHEIRLAIARTKEGDRDAVRFLYVRYSDNVYGYVRSIVRDEQEAEDLTQHVFIKLMTVIAQVQGPRRSVLGLALRMARNVALDHLRKRRRDPHGRGLRPGRPHRPRVRRPCTRPARRTGDSARGAARRRW